MSSKSAAAPVEENGVGEFRFHLDVQSFAFDVVEKDFQAAVADRVFIVFFLSYCMEALWQK